MATPATIEVQTAPVNENLSQLGHWLEEYSEIATILPVVIGLLVTTRLQLRGANALVANIAIAAIARQVIIQVKKQAGHSSTHFATAAAVAEAEEDYTIVHSVPGRIRLHIPRIHSEGVYAKRVEKLLLAEDIVSGVRINRAASSLVIHYDGANLSDLELGMRLLQVLERAEQADPAS
jgi:hypothetical protein